MEYTVTRYAPYPLNQRVVISFELSYHDWCQLEKSSRWSNLQRYLDRLEKQQNRRPQVKLKD